MTTNIKIIRNLTGVLVCTAFLIGCAALQTHPMVARQGDTLTLALGSPDGMTMSNITVEYYSDSAPSTPIDITFYVVGLFNLYPDKLSQAWLTEATVATLGRSAHGPWLTTMVINLPDAGAGLLPVGTGHIEITTTPGEVTYPRFNPEIDTVNISLEILAGNGSPNPLRYADFFGGSIAGDLAKLEPIRHVVVKPPVPVEGFQYSTAYGAVEINVQAAIRDFFGNPVGDGGIRVIADDQPGKERFQMQTLWARNGDNFTIMLTSPLGMYAHQARVSIVPVGIAFAVEGTPTLSSISYYDINGNPTSGSTPTVVVE